MNRSELASRFVDVENLPWEETRYRCALFRDVFPLMVKYVGHDREELLQEAERALVDNKVVKDGDLIVLTIGEPIGKAGGTNTMKIVKVGEHRKP